MLLEIVEFSMPKFILREPNSKFLGENILGTLGDALTAGEEQAGPNCLFFWRTMKTYKVKLFHCLITNLV